MKNIELDSRLGNVALKIKGIANVSEKQMALAYEYAMTFLLFHKVGSKVFRAKGGWDRKAKFSENLAKDVVQACKDIIGDIFTDVAVSTSEYIAADPWDKLRVQMKSLDFSDSAIEKIIAEKKSAAEKPAAVVEADPEEVMLG
jgi:hypothetical protein